MLRLQADASARSTAAAATITRARAAPASSPPRWRTPGRSPIEIAIARRRRSGLCRGLIGPATRARRRSSRSGSRFIETTGWAEASAEAKQAVQDAAGEARQAPASRSSRGATIRRSRPLRRAHRRRAASCRSRSMAGNSRWPLIACRDARREQAQRGHARTHRACSEAMTLGGLPRRAARARTRPRALRSARGDLRRLHQLSTATGAAPPA